MSSEPNSPLGGREDDSTWNVHGWDDNTEEHSLGDNAQQNNPCEPIEARSPSPSPQEYSSDENAMTHDPSSPPSDWGEEDRTSGIQETLNEGIKPENYPLPQSPPIDPFGTDTDVIESTVLSPALEIPPIREVNKSSCVFFRRGACNQGTTCKFSHFAGSDQRASPGVFRSHQNLA